jgi:hypothetical protein
MPTSSPNWVEWKKGTLCDWVLYETNGTTPLGFIMKSGVGNVYTAWMMHESADRMQFTDLDEAKAWIFTQARMEKGN